MENLELFEIPNWITRLTGLNISPFSYLTTDALEKQLGAKIEAQRELIDRKIPPYGVVKFELENVVAAAISDTDEKVYELDIVQVGEDIW